LFARRGGGDKTQRSLVGTEASAWWGWFATTQAYLDKESDKKLKQKQRDKMQPKMGKMDIDYQVLHDAFFRYQTKPKMTGVGEVYYEGKEFEANHEHIKPGKLSEDLREALGMPPGAPPPWLIYMQRCAPRLRPKTNPSYTRSARMPCNTEP